MIAGSTAEMILGARNAGGSAGVDAVDERFVKLRRGSTGPDCAGQLMARDKGIWRNV